MSRPIRLLYVEDNPHDVLFLKYAFDSENFHSEMHVIQDGDSAIRFLTEEAHQYQENWPDLVLLDINLPRKNGIEVLEAIRANQDLLSLPVFMLTSSTAGEDFKKCVQLQITGYLEKPQNIDDYKQIVETIREFCEQIDFVHC